MAVEKNEVAKKPTSDLSAWSNRMTELVTNDFNVCNVPFDDYSKNCAMNAMSSIYQLVKTTDKADIKDCDLSNLREVVGQCASLKLNANAVPREVYFQLRTKKINGNYVKVVEMGIEGDGNDSILRNYGENVDKVYPCWLVHEGDDFTYPKHKGIEIAPPEWEPSGKSEKVVRVVYPIRLKDGTVQYLISERESVKSNLFAHVRNTMMNETFGICEDRYKATDKQKKDIAAKKEEIYEALRKCETVDDMLACEMARPYMSGAWKDTPEAMIIRKMRNNIVKKYPKNFNNMAKQSFNQMDETYVASQEEIKENENSEDFVVESEYKEVEHEKVQGEVVDTTIDDDTPEFMKG